MSKLPLEILKEKYIPVSEFPKRYGISVEEIMNLIDHNQLRYAEFRAPGDTRRSIHVNYEEVLSLVRKGK